MEELFSGDYTMGDSMSDLQLWSQLVAKCQNTDLTIMRLPTSPRNRDTANEEVSSVTEYLTKLNDMCAVETELDDTRHPEHCAQPWTRKVGWNAGFHEWKAQNQGKHDARDGDVVFGVR